jgi:hypothetical protein
MDHWFLPDLKTGLFKNNLQYVLNNSDGGCRRFPSSAIYMAETDLNIMPNRITSYRIRKHTHESSPILNQRAHCTMYVCMYVFCRKFISKM